MELTLKKNNIPFYKKLADVGVNHEETMEMIVPDSLPDIQEVLDSDGTAVLRSKECGDGKLTISGFVRATIVYIPDGGGVLRGLNAQIPFSVSIDAKDAAAGLKMLGNAELAGIEARLLNSRKISVRAFLAVTASAYGESQFSRSPAPDDCPEELELMTEVCELNPVTDISERVFTISEEAQLPAGKPPISMLIKSGVTLTAEELRAAGSKLIVKGSANVLLVYASLGMSDLNSANLVVPFSEIVDLSDYDGADQKTFDVSLSATGLYIQENGGDSTNVVSIEITAMAQAVVCKKVEASYISDAYCTSCEAVCVTEEHNVPSLESEQVFKETVRETLPTTVNARSIVCVRVFPGEAVRSTDGYNVSFRTTVTYCTDDGRTLTASGRLNASFECPGISELSDIRATAVFGEPYAAPVAGGIEVRVPVELHTRVFKNVRINPVSSITMNDELPTDYSKLPSLVLYRVSEGDTLWQLAKHYNSTRSLIIQTNELDNTDLVAGQMLAITKKR